MSGDQDRLFLPRAAWRKRGYREKQFLISYFSGIRVQGVLALMEVPAQPIKRRCAERSLLLHQETLEHAVAEGTAPR